MWRKRVDKSFLRDGTTPIPLWLAKQWELNDIFAFENGKEIVAIKWNHKYIGELTSVDNLNRLQYRLTLLEPVKSDMKKVFYHSYNRLIRDNNDDPVSEFIDIEFDKKKKTFILVAWYKVEQK